MAFGGLPEPLPGICSGVCGMCGRLDGIQGFSGWQSGASESTRVVFGSVDGIPEICSCLT